MYRNSPCATHLPTFALATLAAALCAPAARAADTSPRLYKIDVLNRHAFSVKNASPYTLEVQIEGEKPFMLEPSRSVPLARRAIGHDAQIQVLYSRGAYETRKAALQQTIEGARSAIAEQETKRARWEADRPEREARVRASLANELAALEIAFGLANGLLASKPEIYEIDGEYYRFDDDSWMGDLGPIFMNLLLKQAVLEVIQKHRAMLKSPDFDGAIEAQRKRIAEAEQGMRDNDQLWAAVGGANNAWSPTLEPVELRPRTTGGREVSPLFTVAYGLTLYKPPLSTAWQRGGRVSQAVDLSFPLSPELAVAPVSSRAYLRATGSLAFSRISSALSESLDAPEQETSLNLLSGSVGAGLRLTVQPVGFLDVGAGVTRWLDSNIVVDPNDEEAQNLRSDGVLDLSRANADWADNLTASARIGVLLGDDLSRWSREPSSFLALDLKAWRTPTLDVAAGWPGPEGSQDLPSKGTMMGSLGLTFGVAM